MASNDSRVHIIYAVLSFASPIVAYVVVTQYLSYANAAFHEGFVPGDDASVNAGAMMALAEYAQVAFFTGIGALVGIILAIISLYKSRRLFSLGILALLFNILPFLLLFLLVIHQSTTTQ